MARLWTLGGVTLPNPQGFSRKYVEKSVWHESINGRTTKDISSRKEQYVLSFQRIAQATVAQILALYEQKATLTFEAEDGELIISATEVHVDVPGREYNTKGSEFREDFTLILTEVE